MLAAAQHGSRAFVFPQSQVNRVGMGSPLPRGCHAELVNSVPDRFSRFHRTAIVSNEERCRPARSRLHWSSEYWSCEIMELMFWSNVFSMVLVGPLAWQVIQRHRLRSQLVVLGNEIHISSVAIIVSSWCPTSAPFSSCCLPLRFIRIFFCLKFFHVEFY